MLPAAPDHSHQGETDDSVTDDVTPANFRAAHRVAELRWLHILNRTDESDSGAAKMGSRHSDKAESVRGEIFALLSEFPPGLFQTRVQFSVCSTARAASCQHHNIQSAQQRLMVSKTLAHDSLNAITRYRATNMPFGYGKSKSGNLATVLTTQKCQIAVGYLAGPIKYKPEVSWGTQPVCSSETLAGHDGFENPSNRQTLAAFSTTGIKHLAATACPHASPKSVSAFALKIAGLKCSFHGLTKN